MGTSTYFAIMSITVLFLFNILAPLIVADVDPTSENLVGDNTIRINGSNVDNMDGIGILGAYDFFSTLFAIVFWNWNFGLIVNSILTILKLILIISVAEIVLP